MRKVIIVLIGVVLVVGAALIISNPSLMPRLAPAPQDADRAYLESLLRHPPATYREELLAIIRASKDPAVREQAVFTLTDLAFQENETTAILPSLRELAGGEADDRVRTAAYTSIERIRISTGQGTTAGMEVKVTGTVRRGNPLNITATLSSSRDVPEVLVGIEAIDPSLELLSPGFFSGPLSANAPRSFTFQVRPLVNGMSKLTLRAFFSYDRTDYEERTQELFIDVSETTGSVILSST